MLALIITDIPAVLPYNSSSFSTGRGEIYMATTGIKPTDKTLENLQAAFNGESNASAKYALFAIKADADGYCQAASLFRAASRAEQIHAANHARVIRKLGAEPVANIEDAHVGSTAENLKAAIAGETYEFETMYPGFIAEATASGNSAAVRTFTDAMEAEKEHARMYSEVLANLANATVARTYSVCAVCGYTVDQLEFDRCPLCRNPKEKFEKIS
jgi:rubrerythrin